MSRYANYNLTNTHIVKLKHFLSERSWLQQGYKVGELVIPLARIFYDDSSDLESASNCTVFTSLSANFVIYRLTNQVFLVSYTLQNSSTIWNTKYLSTSSTIFLFDCWVLIILELGSTQFLFEKIMDKNIYGSIINELTWNTLNLLVINIRIFLWARVCWTLTVFFQMFMHATQAMFIKVFSLLCVRLLFFFPLLIIEKRWFG